MNEKWQIKSKIWNRRNSITIDCRFTTSTFNHRYFEVAFGSIDALIRNGSDHAFVAYLRELSDDNVIESWIPHFSERYFAALLDEDEVQIFADRIDGEANPDNTLENKMRFIREYVLKVSFKAIVDVISANLYFFGVLPGLGELSWMSYVEFYSIFYVEPQFQLEDMLRLVNLIRDEQNWSFDNHENFEETQQRLQTCLTMQIEQHFYEADSKWIENLLRFWTSKKWVIPRFIDIYIAPVTEFDRTQKLVNMPGASVCYNTLILNDGMVRIDEQRPFDALTDCQYFRELMDLALSSIDTHGFGAV